MTTNHTIAKTVIASSLLIAGTSALWADSRDDEIRVLREQIQQLDQKLRVLERKQEIKEEESTAAAKGAAKVTASDKAFTLAAPDNVNSLKLRGLVQLDNRLFFNDGGIVNNGFVLRRARIITEGTFPKLFSFQLVPEFGGGNASGASAFSILDANIGLKISDKLQFKAGKFKSPVGLELLQSDSWSFFAERSLATNLVPNRDLGVLVFGDVLGGKLNYTAGVVNGVADGATSGNADFDNDKDFVGRLWATPFKGETGSPFQGLSFGISGSTGREKTASGRTGGYRTDGQQTFFSYAATTVADGQNWRISPQLDYRQGPFGLLGEYVLSTTNVRPSATGAKAELKNKAWQIAAGYVLTGEDSSYAGVVPKTNFDPSAGTWGAFEVVGRYANLKIDEKAFPLYASASSNADEATSFGLGLNWYLSKAVRFSFDYFQTDFGFSPLAPQVSTSAVVRQDEKAFISRFQVAF